MDNTDLHVREVPAALPHTANKLVLPRWQTIREMRPQQVPSNSTHSQSSTRKQLQDANAEIRRLRDELQLAQESAGSRLDNVKSQLRAHLMCGICANVIRDPFALECGHIFCHTCLRQWFSTALTNHVAENPGYDPRSFVPAEYLALIRERRLGSFAHCYLLTIIDHTIAAHIHPAYTCPSCRTIVKSAPIALYPLRALVEEVRGDPEQIDQGAGQQPEWEDFLPFNTRELVATQWLAPSEEME